MTLLQHHVFALGLTAITTSVLGLLVLCANPKKSLNRVFAVYSAAIACWGFSESFLVNAPDKALAWFWLTCEWPGVSFIAPSFLHTVFLFTQRYGKREKILVCVGYVLGGLFIFLHLTSDLVTMTVRPVAYIPYFAKLAPLGHYLPILFFIFVTIGLVTLWRSSRQVVGQRRMQTRYLFWGSLIGYFGGGADWALTLGHYVPLLNPFGIYGVPLYSIATVYAIYQHRLFDIKLVIRKSLIYSVLITLLTVGYFGLMYVLERLFQMTFGYRSFGLSLAAFALMALLFQPLKMAIQQIVDHLIFRAPHEELVKRVERLEEEVRQTEKMKTVATLAAGLAHEIRGPMTTIRTFLSYLPDRYDDEEFRRKCSGVVVAEVNRVNELLTQLMDFAKPRPPAIAPTDAHRLVESTLDFVSNEFVQRRIQVRKEFHAPDPVVPMDGNQIRQVLLNLVFNGLQAMEPGGTLTVGTARDNGAFCIRVQDTGCGIPAKDLPHIFDPFRTTKAQGNGLGLGVAYRIVKEHRGTIAVSSQIGQGTTFTIKIPT